MALHQHVNDRLAEFVANYATHLTRPIALHPTDAVSSLERVCSAVQMCGQRIYLLIDEYDNFANEVLMTGRKQAFYEGLLYGEGELKRIFKAVKAGAGRGVDRVFITGVSPVVLSDRTSGYNIGEDIVFPPEKRTSRTTPALRATPP